MTMLTEYCVCVLSAGIGRTGTFCTLDIILRRLKQILAGNQTPLEDAVNVMTDIKRCECRLSFVAKCASSAPQIA